LVDGGRKLVCSGIRAPEHVIGPSDEIGPNGLDPATTLAVLKPTHRLARTIGGVREGMSLGGEQGEVERGGHQLDVELVGPLMGFSGSGEVAVVSADEPKTVPVVRIIGAMINGALRVRPCLVWLRVAIGLRQPALASVRG
jgi:hypothetical protein